MIGTGTVSAGKMLIFSLTCAKILVLG